LTRVFARGTTARSSSRCCDRLSNSSTRCCTIRCSDSSSQNTIYIRKLTISVTRLTHVFARGRTRGKSTRCSTSHGCNGLGDSSTKCCAIICSDIRSQNRIFNFENTSCLAHWNRIALCNICSSIVEVYIVGSSRCLQCNKATFGTTICINRRLPGVNGSLSSPIFTFSFIQKRFTT